MPILIFVLSVIAAALLAPPVQVAQADKEAPIPGLGATCAACHPEPASEWARTLHRRTVGAPHIGEDQQGCAACHEGAAEHLADPAAEDNRPVSAGLSGNEISDMCLSCHAAGTQMLWSLSPHQTTEQGCLGCHDPHGGYGAAMLKAPEPALCQECHPAEVADTMLPSHHPIPEGKMVCSDCHNVHGDQRGALSATYTAEMCYRCHAEKEGPFLHEHPPVVEDCATCHRPHGAQNDNLLVQDEPLLCLQCHPGHFDSRRGFLVPFDPDDADSVTEAELSTRAFYDRCTSCHVRLHGTDFDSGSGNGTFMPGLPLPDYGEAGGSSQAFSAASVDTAMWGFSGIDFGSLDEDGNQTFVREYDGRDYEVPAFDVDVTKFSEGYDYRLQMKDLARGDEDINLRFGTPIYDVQISHSALTHRLGRYNDPIDGAGLLEFPGRAGGLEDVELTDLTPGKDDFHLDRTTLDVRLAARSPKLSSVKWLVNLWQEAESGDQQFTFLDRCDACHKYQRSERIERRNTILQGGVDITLPFGAVRYLREDREFDNLAPEEFHDFSGVGSVGSGPAPLFGIPSTETDVNDLRASAALGDRVSASLLWRDKSRMNLLGGADVDIGSTGGGLSWRASPDLSVGVSLLSRKYDVSELVHGAVSRDYDSTKVDVRYAGFRGSTLRVGYTKEKVDRESVGADREELPHASDSDIWRASLISRLGAKTRLQLLYKATDTDHEEFFDPAAPPDSFPARLTGLPTDARAFSGTLNYSVSDKSLLTALYSDRDATYRVSVPALAVSRQSDDRRKTTGVQFSHHPSSRSRLSAAYYRQDGETGADVTYGTDTFTLEPPLSLVDIAFPTIDSVAAFDYDANIGLVDASYWATSRLRLFGRYAQTRSEGVQTLLGLGDYFDQDPDVDGVDMTFHPFDLDIMDTWVGVGYLVTPHSEVALSYQRRSWDNSDDPTQDGSYDVWRVGVRGEF